MSIVTLSRRSGESETFIIRRCGEGDLADIMALQQSVYDALEDKTLCVPSDEPDVAESLREDYCLGAYVCSDTEQSDSGTNADKNCMLAAVTIMVVNRVSPRNYGKYVGYDEEGQRRCVSMDVTMVAPEYRGYGLQKTFVSMREEEARRLGATEALVTISPDNTHSIDNFLKSGYEVLRTCPVYGDLVRSILRKEL